MILRRFLLPLAIAALVAAPLVLAQTRPQKSAKEEDRKAASSHTGTTRATVGKDVRQEPRRTPEPADARGRSDQEQPDEPEEERRREP